MQITGSAIFRDASHQLVRLLWRGGHFPTIEIDGQSRVALIRQFGGLLLDPVIKSPPFMDDYEPRKGTFARGYVKHALHRFIPALVRNVLAVGGE